MTLGSRVDGARAARRRAAAASSSLRCVGARIVRRPATRGRARSRDELIQREIGERVDRRVVEDGRRAQRQAQRRLKAVLQLERHQRIHAHVEETAVRDPGRRRGDQPSTPATRLAHELGEPRRALERVERSEAPGASRCRRRSAAGAESSPTRSSNRRGPRDSKSSLKTRPVHLGRRPVGDPAARQPASTSSCRPDGCIATSPCASRRCGSVAIHHAAFGPGPPVDGDRRQPAWPAVGASASRKWFGRCVERLPSRSPDRRKSKRRRRRNRAAAGAYSSCTHPRTGDLGREDAALASSKRARAMRLVLGQPCQMDHALSVALRRASAIPYHERLHRRSESARVAPGRLARGTSLSIPARRSRGTRLPVAVVQPGQHADRWRRAATIQLRHPAPDAADASGDQIAWPSDRIARAPGRGTAPAPGAGANAHRHDTPPDPRRRQRSAPGQIQPRARRPGPAAGRSSPPIAPDDRPR